MYTQLVGLSRVRYTIHQTGGRLMSAQCYKRWTGIFKRFSGNTQTIIDRHKTHSHKHFHHPSQHNTPATCQLNAGPPSALLAQYETNIGSVYHVFWDAHVGLYYTRQYMWGNIHNASYDNPLVVRVQGFFIYSNRCK